MANDGSLAIRVASAADADGLAHLRHQWRAGDDGVDLKSFQPEFADWMAEHDQSHFPFLAERQGEPIGMAWLVVVDRVPGPQHFIRRSAYIQSVYVIARERSSGIGTLLMTILLEYAQNLGLDYIAVHPSNQSFPLYRRLGFTETDRVLEMRSEVRNGSLPVLPHQ
jgi:GNAT superfamily N-acetyltransferase